MEKNTKERFFSIELKSRANLKNINFSNGSFENVLVEGSIGVLQRACFDDGVVLKIVGDKGALRINLSEEDIKKKEKRS